MKKELIGIFVCVLLVGTVLPVTGNVIVNKTPLSVDNGNTLYVGGSGPGNYSTIHEAIDDAVDRDNVFVFDDSSPYVENLIVDKSINLMGEDKQTTVIDGNNNEEGEGDVIHIKADGVTVRGFTIKNCSNFGNQTNYFCGIEIRSNYNLIKDNIITRNYHGIQMGSIPDGYSNNNVIENNIIINNRVGVILLVGNDNLVSGNFISLNSDVGLNSRFEGNSSVFQLNNVTLNYCGIYADGVKNITITHNNIFDNKLGIQIEWSSNVNVFENNIYNNDRPGLIASFLINAGKDWMSNKFSSNYWGKERLFPMLIPGVLVFLFGSLITDFFGFDGPLYFNFFKVDWNPAKEPYDIGI